MYDAIFIRPWPGWLAGPLIGLYAVAFFVFMRRNLGASSGFPAILEALRGVDDPAHLDLSKPDDPLLLPKMRGEQAPRWRVWWLAGLLCAGLLDWALRGDGTGGADLPGFTETFGLIPLWLKACILGLGGLFIGFGTRMSGGCTSGHAIFGLSQRQLPSLYATLTFFAVGIGVTFLVRAGMAP